MPQYKTHAKFNIFLALPVALIILIYYLTAAKNNILIFSLSFVYATLFMNPDLDLTNKIKLFSIRGFLSFPFRTYSYVFRHRGLSHSLFFGTITRLLWLFLFFLVISYLFNITFLQKINFTSLMKVHKEEIIYLFSGFFIADFFHVILDRIHDKI